MQEVPEVPRCTEPFLTHQRYVRMVKMRLQPVELPARENFKPFVFKAVRLTVTSSSSNFR